MLGSDEKYKTEVADFSIHNDIVYMKFTPTQSHGIKEAKLVVEKHNALSGGKKTAVLADLRDVTTGANRAARKYYVGPESAEFKLGMAMLVVSPFQRMLGNIFIYLGNPPYPTRLFSSEPDAIKWLEELSNKNNE